MGLVLSAFMVLLIIGVPVAFVIVAASGIGVLNMGFDPMILIQQLFQGMNKFTYLAIPFFIMSGDIAAQGLTSERLLDAINAWLGRVRGGLGIACVVACIFYGAITGSAIACVIAVGAFMMPKLLESGYPRSLVIGVITAAGTLGVMIPPSVPMLTYCLAMGTSAGKLFTAGFIPGILLGAMFCLYVYIVAVKNKIPVSGEKLSFVQKLKITGRSAWALMFPIIVLGSIYGGLATPTEAAVISLFYVILVELFVYKKLTLKDMFNILKKSIISSATLTITIATAQVFCWFLTTSQFTTKVYDVMVANIGSGLGLLFIMALLFLIAGCFTNVTTVCIILGPILQPVFAHFGVDLYHFGICTILMSQIGFLTPPFGFCLFVAMRVAKASMGEVAKAVLPFLLIMLVAEVIFILFPQLSLWLPGLVLG